MYPIFLRPVVRSFVLSFSRTGGGEGSGGGGGSGDGGGDGGGGGGVSSDRPPQVPPVSGYSRIHGRAGRSEGDGELLQGGGQSRASVAGRRVRHRTGVSSSTPPILPRLSAPNSAANFAPAFTFAQILSQILLRVGARVYIPLL